MLDDDHTEQYSPQQEPWRKVQLDAAAELNQVLDKAIPDNILSDGMEFHIVWNPGHPRNPRFAFANLEQAQQLQYILSRHLEGKFFIMSHYTKSIF